MWVVMSTADREEFLAGARIGVLSAGAGRPGRTLAVPVWYSYQPGALLTVLTGRRSRKAAAIRAAGRFGLCVHDDSPPYRYVSVEGPVVGEEELDPAATSAQRAATVTSRTTRTLGVRTWPSGCTRSTG
jgi:nitroimidazol reductase NimA-like FMN-containing flavoprotein (pyridoxamine 5'-phosphate oxidase superfamily)